MNDRDSIDRYSGAGKGDRHRCNFDAYQKSSYWENLEKRKAEEKQKKEEGSKKQSH